MTTAHDAADRDGHIRIHTFVLGPFETNCYVVQSAMSDACLLVDAGFEPAEMIAFVREHALRPASLLLTHAHADHIAGVHDVRAQWPELPILIHDAERQWLTDPQRNLSAGMGLPVTAPEATGSLAEGDRITLDDASFDILHTPGHSPGGVTLHCEEAGVALVGDALFAGSIGRTDFPGSDMATLAASIRTKLYTLPDDTTVYSGHGPATTIGREKRTNPFVPA